ncbi:MAG: LysM peptidoglycan-binding domain-containing protein [Deltaproteobacteria bacterium]|nr:LysM peptidoglycan-binding domain-containing protein [Deltaproteobacteria bacterium]
MALVFWSSLSAFAQTEADGARDQSAQAESARYRQSGGTTDIVLTKTVEVYSYEDLTFSIDSYTIRPGDNIANILKAQGLWPQKADAKRESQLLRLVSELNPVIANINQISAGQTIYLPSSRGLEEARAQAQAQAEAQAALSQYLDPNMETKNVATYELNQPAQSPARVVVRRQVAPEEELAEGEYRIYPDGKAPEEPPAPAQVEPVVNPVIPFVGQGQPPVNVASNEKAPAETVSDASAPEPLAQSPAPPARAQSQAQASGNEGPLATSSDGTVYRTVTVRRGDTLEKLLRREGLDRNLIYRHLIKLTVELNPGLKNPNLIVAGAELRIPASGSYLAGYGYEGAVAAHEAAPRAAQTAQTTQTAQAAQKAQGNAALPPSSGAKDPAAGSTERYLIPTKRLPAASLPTMDSVNAKTALGVIFTRLGETMVTKGRLFMPLDEAPHFDIDTAANPVIELNNGRKIILDYDGNIEANLIKRFTAKYTEYSVFQPAKKEGLDKALEKLLALANYYRVYGKNQAFEGGRDVKLKISADWLIWPSVDTWNKGQPTIINLAPAADNGTPPVWVRFLSDHGMKVIDLFQGRLVSSAGASPTPVNNFTVIEVDQNPSAFAAALIRSLGYSPRVGVKVDSERGRVVTGGAEADLGNMPPVFWETEKGRFILEYGDLSTEELQILRKNGFNIISSPKEFRPVLKSILDTENITLGGNLVLNGNSTGGPAIELTIAGQSFQFNGRSYLFTPVSLPDNMTSLDPNQNVVVLHYRQGPVATYSGGPSPSGPTPGGPSAASAGSAPTSQSAAQGPAQGPAPTPGSVTGGLTPGQTMSGTGTEVGVSGNGGDAAARDLTAETLTDGAGTATITVEPE